ncbi:hypothetical protein [Streptomyces salinarius]|uniref:hypothetical protein n=1 Tax=Streptomyces salinarius TaxID=2762598 RepID=UPI00285279C7|nr:hypothetical protein [Streptomyces salinarius]
MTTNITPEAAAAVFTAAASVTGWRRTNLGLRAEVAHAGCRWTVVLPVDSRAEITHREHTGDVEHVHALAPWSTTVTLVDAAVAAVRPS